MKNRHPSQIIFCYTGEPRLAAKGIQIRNQTLAKASKKGATISSLYLTCFSSTGAGKKMIFDAIKDFSKDNHLYRVMAHKKEPANIYKYILEQKLDLLNELRSRGPDTARSVIVLTRTDWKFDAESLELVCKAFESGRIILPKTSSETRVHDQTTYKPICDQFMAIPGEKLANVINVLKTSMVIADLQQDKRANPQRDIMLGGDGANRFGLGPEALLGIGFAHACKIDDYSEEEFKFAFKPGTFDACSHNLLRQDAGKWMKLTQYDLARKKWMHYKGVLLSLREKAIKILIEQS
jgi:hypothetical protein